MKKVIYFVNRSKSKMLKKNTKKQILDNILLRFEKEKKKILTKIL